ncbi:hypothetical protein SAMD00019534_117230, partial [Acytostelium subglobosum LB1]|uniref:hypothetical protein n=1 Tax=Acytostelium subglobosum LB1 TaxID=1410327 RepID=UPI0006448453
RRNDAQSTNDGGASEATSSSSSPTTVTPIPTTTTTTTTDKGHNNNNCISKDTSLGESVITLLMWCYSERDFNSEPVNQFFSKVYDHYHLSNFQINQFVESHSLCNYTLYANSRHRTTNQSSSSSDPNNNNNTGADTTNKGTAEFYNNSMLQRLEKESICSINDEKDKEIRDAIDYLKKNGIKQHLDMNQTQFVDWELAEALLSHINLYQTPRDKIMTILRFTRAICQGLRETGKTFGSDEVISCVVYVIVQKNPDFLYTNTKYVDDKSKKSISNGIRNVFERTTSNYRGLKIALAAAVGGTLLAVTGGLVAAPILGGVLHLVGATYVLTALTAAGISGTALTSLLFGAAGATLSADIVKKNTSGLEEFSINKVNQTFGLHVNIGALGWVESEDGKKDMIEWEQNLLTGVLCLGEVDIIEWENKLLLQLFESLKNYKKSVEDSSKFAKFTSRMLHDAILPSASILEAFSLIKTCWGTVKERAQKAGVLLADEIMNKRFGRRPLTLFGISMGARLMYYCLLELIKHKQYGIIENVVFIGAPIPVDLKIWGKIRKLVSGRVVNCYSSDDVLLQYCYEANSLPDERKYIAAGFSPVRKENNEIFSFSSVFVDTTNVTSTTNNMDQTVELKTYNDINNNNNIQEQEQEPLLPEATSSTTKQPSSSKKTNKQQNEAELKEKRLEFYLDMIENVDVRAIISSHLDYQKSGVLKNIFNHVNINKSEPCKPYILVKR